MPNVAGPKPKLTYLYLKPIIEWMGTLRIVGGRRLLQEKEIYSRIFEAVAAARLQVG